MKRKVLAVGIILLFVGVAVAPSFNSTVVKASNDNRTIGRKIPPQSVSIFLKRTSDVFKRVDSIKHSLLYLIVFVISASRLIRGYFFLMISLNNGYTTILLLFLRGYWLVLTAKYWEKFWNDVSDSQGWNWPQL